MSFVATAIIGSGAIGAGASLFASNRQQKSVQNAQNLQMQLLPIATAEVQNYTGQGVQSIKDLVQQAMGTQAGYVGGGVNTLSPFASGGQSAFKSLLSLITPGGGGAAALADTPGFQFTRDWGMRGINNAASTSGFGGNVLKAGADYSGGLASQTWQSVVSALQSAAGLGGTAAGGISSLLGSAGNTAASLLGSAGASIGSLLGGAGGSLAGLISGTGGNLSNLAVQQGNAQAAGTMGAAGGIGNALSGVSNMLLLKNLLSGGGAPFSPGGAWSSVGNPATAGALY